MGRVGRLATRVFWPEARFSPAAWGIMRGMISFIIPAYNEERLLGATLDALHVAAQAVGEAYELIVVDDASTDATPLIAERLGARVVRVAHRQIAATRNSGARAALGEWLIFVDADTVVNAAVVRSAVAALRNGVAGGGAAVGFDGVLPFYAKLLLPVFVRLFRFARLAAGCFLSRRRVRGGRRIQRTAFLR
jgi:glycosyltransferase involved in cell wall biosynthesis